MDIYWFNCTTVLTEREEGEVPHLVQFSHVMRQRPSPGPRCGKLYFWVLDYHRAPAGSYSLNGRDWRPRRARTAHLYAPDTNYWERCEVGELPFPETFIVFRASPLPVLGPKVAKENGFALFEDAEGILADRFHDLFDVAAGRGGEWLAQGALLRILDVLQGASGAEGHYRIVSPDVETLAPEARLARQVDGYLMAHYAKSISLDDVAAALGVSRSTLTHQYRSATGSSPMARLMRYRLDTALGMMLRGESIKAVALRTGFCDAYHFSKAFRQQFGQPPRRYVREVAGV